MKYETINKVSSTPTNISCGGNETALRNCTSTELPATSACQLLLVDCSSDITVGDPTVDPKDKDGGSDSGGVLVMAGVGVGVFLLVTLLVVVVSAIAVVKCIQRLKPKITTTHNSAYNVVVRSDTIPHVWFIPWLPYVFLLKLRLHNRVYASVSIYLYILYKYPFTRQSSFY